MRYLIRTWMRLLLVVFSTALIACGGAQTPEPEMPRPRINDVWDFSDTAATRAEFQALLNEEAALSDPDWRAQLLTQIARTHGLEGNYDQARDVLATVPPIMEPGSVAEVRYELELGRVFNSSGEPAEAMPHFQRAADIAEAIGETDEFGPYLYVDALHMMGIAAPPEEQVQYNEQALAYAESSDDHYVARWRGPLYNNLGWTYSDLGDHERALELFERDIAWRTESRASQTQIWIARWARGRQLRSLGRLDEALEAQMAIHDERLEADNEDGFVYEELGEILIAQERYDEAQPHFERAVELLSQVGWFVESENARYQRLRRLAEDPRSPE